MWGTEKGGPMNFEVNGIPYFLAFDSRAEEWCLLTPSRDGIEAVEIYDDEPLAVAVPTSGGERRVN